MYSETALKGSVAPAVGTTGVRVIDAILFDLGDTLLHYERPKRSILAEAALRPLHDRLAGMGHSLPPWPKYLRAIQRGMFRSWLWSKLTHRELQLGETLCRDHRRLGVRMPPGELVAVAESCLTPPLRRYFTLDRMAIEVVRHLHEAGYKLGVVSNTVLPGSSIDALLRDGGLLEFFPVRIYSSEVRYMKPNPRIFHLALAGLQTPAARTLFVGDHVINDLKGPARMGMKTVLAVHGESIPRTPRRPDHIIRSLTELPAILERYVS